MEICDREITALQETQAKKKKYVVALQGSEQFTVEGILGGQLCECQSSEFSGGPPPLMLKMAGSAECPTRLKLLGW